MDIQIWVAVGSVILLGIVLIFYFSPSYAEKVTATAIGPYSLETQTTIVQNQEAQPYYSDANGSFSAFVYLSPMNRTGVNTACGVGPNEASCADGTFAACPCDQKTNDCSTCQHAGYKSVFNIAGIVGLEILNAPDASRQGRAMAQVIIKTEGPVLMSGSSVTVINPSTSGSGSGSGCPTPSPTAAAQIAAASINPSNSQKYIETLILPPIPLQKWTMVTIAREGRRFDIYLDDKLVLSQKTMYMPVSNISNSNFKGITSGSLGLVGQLSIANVHNYRLSSQDVVSQYTKLADTRGRPYTTNALTFADLTGLTPGIGATGINSYSICPKGGCFSPPAIRPASPLYEWSTSYA